MSWKEKIQEWGPASLLFLSTDGSSTNFIVVADPVLLDSKFRNKVQQRIGCPVVTQEGFMLFVVGKRLARKLASLEDKFRDHVINVTRHGAEGDTDTTYEVAAIQDAKLYKELQKVKAATYNDESLQEAIAEAKDVLSR